MPISPSDLSWWVWVLIHHDELEDVSAFPVMHDFVLSESSSQLFTEFRLKKESFHLWNGAPL